MNNQTPPEEKKSGARSAIEVAALIMGIVPVLLLWAFIVQLGYRWFVAPLATTWPSEISIRASIGLGIIVMTLRGGGNGRAKGEKVSKIIVDAIALQCFRLVVIYVAHLLIGPVH